MCGLVGCSGIIHAAEKQIFTTLFFLNSLRGVDGCGVSVLSQERRNSYCSTVKSAMSSDAFVKDDKYKRVLETNGVHTIIGHSRAATVGEIKIENNHPFEVVSEDTKDSVIELVGAHNGTIRGQFEGSSKFSTDSEAVFNLINKMGPKKAIESILKSTYNAAYALVWFNFTDNSLNFLRNEDRPLFIVKHSSDIYWASEKWMLQAAFARAGKKPDQYEIYEVPVHSLVKYFPDKQPKDRFKVVPNYITKPEKTFTYSGNFRSGAAYGVTSQFRRDFDEDYGRNWNNKSTKEESFENKKALYDLFGEPQYKISKIMFGEKQLKSIISNRGCSWCSDKNPDNIDKGRFTERAQEFFCDSCVPNVLECEYHTQDQLYLAEKVA